MNELVTLSKLSDESLAESLKHAAGQERNSAVDVVAHLIEFDKRRLYAPLGFPSLFEYCVRELGYPEEAAYKRIRAARAAAKFPLILKMLREDQVRLSAIVVLHPHLTPENHQELLDRARGLSTRALEFLAAGLSPKPDISDNIRRLPEIPPISSARDPSKALIPVTRSMVKPLSSERARIAFTASSEVLQMIDRAKELLPQRYSRTGLERVFTDALTALLRIIDPDRGRKNNRLKQQPENIARPDPRYPLHHSRNVPQAVRDAVWRRDGGRCVFMGSNGIRCLARGGLEFDHIKPYALGGRSDDASNIRLLCRAHNQLEGCLVFGDMPRALEIPSREGYTHGNSSP